MHLTLMESDRSFLRSAECASLSVLAHAGLVCLALGITAGGRLLPADEREARTFFLLPPDRVKAPLGQLDVIRWEAVGGGLDGGTWLTGSGDGVLGPAAGSGTARPGERSYARGDLPFGPPARLFDSTFTVLEVDAIVERYEGTAAPAYPADLAEAGVEGVVRASYVVDATGRVDTTTIRIMSSDDPRFTASVQTALGEMRFRPAKRRGKPVRQLVEQRFRFQIGRSAQIAAHAS
ncbi:MAG: energy transducer TonB [Gemmatimonadales bacterium]